MGSWGAGIPEPVKIVLRCLGEQKDLLYTILLAHTLQVLHQSPAKPSISPSRGNGQGPQQCGITIDLNTDTG